MRTLAPKWRFICPPTSAKIYYVVIVWHSVRTLIPTYSPICLPTSAKIHYIVNCICRATLAEIHCYSIESCIRQCVNSGIQKQPHLSTQHTWNTLHCKLYQTVWEQQSHLYTHLPEIHYIVNCITQCDNTGTNVQPHLLSDRSWIIVNTIRMYHLTSNMFNCVLLLV